MQNILKEKLPAKLSIFVLELSAVTVIIIALTAVRFIGGNVYTDIKNWYILHFAGETDINEVLAEDSAETVLSAAPNQTEDSVIEVMARNYAAENSVNSLFFPVKNAQLTSPYGDRINPVTHKPEKHKGIDLATENSAPIYAAAAGKVIYAANSPTYGNYMIVEHGQGLKTLYAHCSKLLRQEGDTVKQGEKIALVGSTGQSTAPHLHFEVRVNDININPEYLLDW